MVGFAAAALPGQRVAQGQAAVEALLAFQCRGGQSFAQAQIAQAQRLLCGDDDVVDRFRGVAGHQEHRAPESVSEVSVRMGREPGGHFRPQPAQVRCCRARGDVVREERMSAVHLTADPLHGPGRFGGVDGLGGVGGVDGLDGAQGDEIGTRQGLSHAEVAEHLPGRDG